MATTEATANAAPAPEKVIPKPAEFLVTAPLYSKVSFSGAEVWKILDILYYRGTYDSFCTECQRESTFQAVGPERPADFVRNIELEKRRRAQGITTNPPHPTKGAHLLHTLCTRNNSHSQDFVFFIETKVSRNEANEIQIIHSLEKIGQHPSYGDLHRSEVRQYSSVLSRSQLGELTRAISLASHDVGIAAYVYLRRIFEGLIEEAHQLERTEKDWDEKAYFDMRMPERISRLSHHLPAFLVENASMYGLLSKGIHELSEDECLKHFDTLRIAVELILDEKLEMKKKEAKTRAAKAAMQAALSEANAPKKA